MGINEILTTITILIALAAFLSESSRKYVFMKFSKSTWSMFCILFIIIHFLLAFDWISDKFLFLNIFRLNGFPSANVWAYFFTLLLLSLIVYKFFFGFYPASKKDSVLQAYINLILKGEFAFLVNVIEKYHFEDIIKYLNIVKSIKEVDNDGLNEKEDKAEDDGDIFKKVEQSMIDWQIKEQKYLRKYNDLINTNRLKYADIIYHKTVLNDMFVDFVVINNPYFFTPIIKELNETKLKQEDFINKFLQLLTKNKNYYFFSEIKSVTYYSENNWIIPDDAKILHAITDDIKVAEINEAWRGIADEALLEMENEAKKPNSPLRERDSERHSDTLWSYRIKIAIHYFDIIVRQAINQGSNCSMWMFYYYYFTEAILLNLNKLVSYDSDINRYTRNFDLLQQIIEYLMDWKSVVIKSGNPQLIKQIYYTSGACISSIATHHNLRFEDKNYLLGWFLENLLKTYEYEDMRDEKVQEIINKVLEYGFSAFHHPFNNYSYKKESESGQEYIATIKAVFNSIDTIGLLGVKGVKERINKFRVEVINKFDENKNANTITNNGDSNE